MPHEEEIDKDFDMDTRDDQDDEKKTDPPETVFKKLKPSNDRYTLLRDEL